MVFWDLPPAQDAYPLLHPHLRGVSKSGASVGPLFVNDFPLSLRAFTQERSGLAAATLKAGRNGMKPQNRLSAGDLLAVIALPPDCSLALSTSSS